MKIRTDFHSVNLAIGEKTRSIVGDGQTVDETVAAQPSHASGETSEAIKEMNKALACLYLAVEPSVADDVILKVREGIAAHRSEAAQAMAEKAAQHLEKMAADSELHAANTDDEKQKYDLSYGASALRTAAEELRSLAGAEPSHTVYQRTLAAAARFIDSSQYQVTGQMLLDALGGGEPQQDELATQLDTARMIRVWWEEGAGEKLDDYIAELEAREPGASERA